MRRAWYRLAGLLHRKELPRGARRAGRVFHPACVESRSPSALVVLSQLEVKALAMHPHRNAADAGPGVWSAGSYDDIEHPAKPTAARRSWPRGSSIGYWMISSARTSNDWGMVIPRAFAVFTLMINWSCELCSTGRSAGLVPFRILST